MRILHVISSSGMYGAEAVILNLCRSLNESGHDCQIAVFAHEPEPNLELWKKAQAHQVESHIIPCKGRVDRQVTGRIRDLARNVKADIVHAHGYKADVYTYFALRKRRVPLLSTCHTWYDNDPLVTFYGVLDRHVLRRFDSVIAVSREVSERVLKAGVPAEKVHLIRNGIDVRPFVAAAASRRDAPEIPGPMTVGIVGRLAPEKGIDVFIRAALLVLQWAPGTRFVIVGDGPEGCNLRELANQLHVEDSISFLGLRNDMPEVYLSFDLFVSSSRQEGLPMAILEAMASGLPVIATKVGEVSTVITQGATGLLVDPENSEQLARSIVALLGDSLLRSQLGSSAIETVARDFSAQRMANDYVCLYESTLNSAERRDAESAPTVV